MEKAQSRFSDQLLYEFHQEFKEHKEHYERRMEHDDDRFEALLTTQEENARALTSTIESVDKLVKETRDILQLYGDFKGLARIGNGLCVLASSLMKLGVVGVALSALIFWLTDYLKKIGVTGP